MYLKRVKITSVVILILLSSTPLLYCLSSSELVIEFFYHPDCGPCNEPKKILEVLEVEYYPNVKVIWRNMEYKEAMELFFEKYQLYKRPVVVFNQDAKTALYNLTEAEIRVKIEYYMQYYNISDKVDSVYKPLITLPIVVTSGLIDGINPCAFSLLIFFLSFLFSAQKSWKNVMSLGLFYIMGVFLGYIALGLGIIKTVTLFGVFHPFGLISVIMLFTMGVLQIRDSVTFEKPLMKFPERVVPFFKRMTEKTTIPIALFLGIIVSLFEFPCSGAIYIGILLLIMKSSFMGVFYLIIYNLMFIAPLLLILVLASNAENLVKMDEWRVLSKRRVKLVSGIFLVALSFATLFILYKL